MPNQRHVSKDLVPYLGLYIRDSARNRSVNMAGFMSQLSADEENFIKRRTWMKSACSFWGSHQIKGRLSF